MLVFLCVLWVGWEPCQTWLSAGITSGKLQYAKTLKIFSDFPIGNYIRSIQIMQKLKIEDVKNMLYLYTLFYMYDTCILYICLYMYIQWCSINRVCSLHLCKIATAASQQPRVKVSRSPHDRFTQAELGFPNCKMRAAHNNVIITQTAITKCLDHRVVFFLRVGFC